MRRPGQKQRRLEAEYNLPLREILLRDLNRGLEQQQMAKLYRVSPSVVGYWMMRENIKRRVTWE